MEFYKHGENGKRKLREEGEHEFQAQFISQSTKTRTHISSRGPDGKIGGRDS